MKSTTTIHTSNVRGNSCFKNPLSYIFNLCLIFPIFMIPLTINKNSSPTSILNDISTSLKNDLLYDITISESSCPSKMKLGFWHGTENGCLCSSIPKRGSCGDKERNSCSSISSRKGVSIYKWKNKYICPHFSSKNRTYLSYLESASSNGTACKEGYKKCGKLDTVNNTLCIEKDEECPLNLFVINTDSNPPKTYGDINIKTITYNDMNNETYYLHYSNEAIDNYVIREFAIGESKRMCMDSSEYYSRIRYLLDIGGKCTKSYAGSVYDNWRYHHIDVYNKSEVFYENDIMNKVSNLPNYPITELFNTMNDLYFRPYLGFNKEYIDEVRDIPILKKNFERGYDNVNNVMILSVFLMIFQILICFFSQRKVLLSVDFMLSGVFICIYLFIFGLLQYHLIKGILYFFNMTISEHQLGDIITNDIFTKLIPEKENNFKYLIIIEGIEMLGFILGIYIYISRIILPQIYISRNENKNNNDPLSLNDNSIPSNSPLFKESESPSFSQN